MSAVKRLMTNTISMFIAQGLQPFLTIVLVFIIGRTLGPKVFGKYTIIFQLFSIFQITCSLGLKTLLTREVATNKENANKLLINGLLLGIPAALLNIIFVVVVVLLLKYESDIAFGSYLIAISLIAASLVDIFSGILTGFEEMKNLAVAWIIFIVLKTGISIVALLLGYGLYALVIIHVITKFILALFIYYYLFRVIGKPKLEIDFALCKKLISMGWSLALAAISISLFWRIDAIMLSKMVSEEMVGNFGAAYRVVNFIIMTVRSFSLAFFPMIAMMYVDNMDDFNKSCRKAIRYLTILSLPIALITTFAAPDFMPFLWGDKFDHSSSVLVLQVMIWSLIPFGITEIFASALIASERQVTYFILKSLSLVIKIVLNYYLTLKYGIVGVAISTVFAICLLLIMQLPYVVPRLVSFKISAVTMPLLRLCVIIALMILLYYTLHNYHFIVAMIAASITYAVLLFLFKLFSNEDKDYIFRLIKRRI